MNRRTSIKQILIIGTLGITSASFFKWFQITKQVNPEAFNSYQKIIADLADTIIPRTETPGAKDARVDVFIIDVLQHCTGVKEQNNFLKGLNKLEDYSVDKYKRTFIHCNASEKIRIVRYFEAKSNYGYQILNKIDNKLFGMPFFQKLKELTIEGYCTSQLGATKALAYDYIPGSYDSCIPLIENQRSWATK